jgi:hypothetical protein
MATDIQEAIDFVHHSNNEEIEPPQSTHFPLHSSQIGLANSRIVLCI